MTPLLVLQRNFTVQSVGVQKGHSTGAVVSRDMVRTALKLVAALETATDEDEICNVEGKLIPVI